MILENNPLVLFQFKDAAFQIGECVKAIEMFPTAPINTFIRLDYGRIDHRSKGNLVFRWLRRFGGCGLFVKRKQVFTMGIAPPKGGDLPVKRAK